MYQHDHGRCYYENWTPFDLKAFASRPSQEDKWILIMGTSRIRGVFLSAIDHLINGKQGEFKGIDKCWGRMDVEVGKIRLTYQDFRALGYSTWPLPTNSRITCHNANVVVTDDLQYHQNSSKCVSNFFKPTENIPTTIVFEYFHDQSPEVYYDLVFQHLHVDFTGSAIAIFFRSLVTGHMDTPPLTVSQKMEWSKNVAQRRNVSVDVIDTFDIILP